MQASGASPRRLANAASCAAASSQGSATECPQTASAPFAQRNAFSAFSAACCARKHARFQPAPRSEKRASSRSRRAWASQRSASLVDHLRVTECRAEEARPCALRLELLRRVDEEVERDPRLRTPVQVIG